MSRDSVGALLKSERENRELSIEELSNTTRIPRRTLQSIEDDRFDELPSGVFVRGFIKAYASAVDLDADEALARFSDRQPTRPALPPPPWGVDRRRGYGLILAVTMVALFTIIVVTFATARRVPAQNGPIELSSAPSCQAASSKAGPCSFGPSITATPTASSRS